MVSADIDIGICACGNREPYTGKPDEVKNNTPEQDAYGDVE